MLKIVGYCSACGGSDGWPHAPDCSAVSEQAVAAYQYPIIEPATLVEANAFDNTLHDAWIIEEFTDLVNAAVGMFRKSGLTNTALWMEEEKNRILGLPHKNPVIS